MRALTHARTHARAHASFRLLFRVPRSGLYGFGFENGPFLAQQDGSLQLNPMSWNRFATVVWIEQPAGVGFSYSSNANDYNGAYNDTVAASDNAAFLSAFFAQYPQYQNLDLYLTSESYGGCWKSACASELRACARASLISATPALRPQAATTSLSGLRLCSAAATRASSSS